MRETALDYPVTVKEYDVASLDTFGAKSQLRVGDASYEIFRIDDVEGQSACRTA